MLCQYCHYKPSYVALCQITLAIVDIVVVAGSVTVVSRILITRVCIIKLHFHLNKLLFA